MNDLLKGLFKKHLKQKKDDMETQMNDIQELFTNEIQPFFNYIENFDPDNTTLKELLECEDKVFKFHQRFCKRK
jgi:hypothetical protein